MPDPLDVKKEDLFLLVCIVYNVVYGRNKGLCFTA